MPLGTLASTFSVATVACPFSPATTPTSACPGAPALHSCATLNCVVRDFTCAAIRPVPAHLANRLPQDGPPEKGSRRDPRRRLTVRKRLPGGSSRERCRACIPWPWEPCTVVRAWDWCGTLRPVRSHTSPVPRQRGNPPWWCCDVRARTGADGSRVRTHYFSRKFGLARCPSRPCGGAPVVRAAHKTPQTAANWAIHLPTSLRGESRHRLPQRSCVRS
jgi:hypothetical protein